MIMKVKVEKVIHPSAWINGISVGEVRVANIPPMRAHAVRNLASRFNRLLGEEKGRFLHVSYNSYAHRMAICAISMEQRNRELDILVDEHEWKEKLPEDFFSDEPWEKGQEYE